MRAEITLAVDFGRSAGLLGGKRLCLLTSLRITHMDISTCLRYAPDPVQVKPTVIARIRGSAARIKSAR